MLHPAIGCGTSTTGTGTLTLAAVPASVGLVDPNAWAKTTGIGFVSTNAILVPYIIKEFTDTTFSKPLNTEKGWGTLTLGAALVNATLARTTVQETWSANADTFTVSAPSAITIGTAANVLVFIGPSATELPMFGPYFETTSGDNKGALPLCIPVGSGGTGTLVSGTDRYQLFIWTTPMLVKRLTIRTSAAYTGGTSNVYGRIYAVNSVGRPGKLLYDFGVIGTGNASLGTAPANISSGASGGGYFLTPGTYFLDILPIFTGGSGSPALISTTTPVVSGLMGSSGLLPTAFSDATSGSSTTPDPANTTAYAVFQTGFPCTAFALAPS